MATASKMTPADLRAWQAHMGYTYDTAAAALGINRSTYANLLSGVDRHTGLPKAIDRRTALACAAIAAEIGEWKPSNKYQGADHALAADFGSKVGESK